MKIQQQSDQPHLVSAVPAKKTKTKQLLLAQTPEQVKEVGKQIEHIMTEVLPIFIDVQLARCRGTIEDRLGLTREDLLNDFREQVWRAIVTYNPEMGASLSTYAKRLIENSVSSKTRKSYFRKYSSTEYCADTFKDTAVADQSAYVDMNTGEAIFEKRAEYLDELSNLPDAIHRAIYHGLLEGRSITEMMTLEYAVLHGLASEIKRTQVVGAINRVMDVVRKSRSQDDI